MGPTYNRRFGKPPPPLISPPGARGVCRAGAPGDLGSAASRLAVCRNHPWRGRRLPPARLAPSAASSTILADGWAPGCWLYTARPMRPLIILAALVALEAPAGAKPVDMVQALGYVVFAVDTVKGTFEGCEHGRQIEFEAGGAVECLEYGYQYSTTPVLRARVYPACARKPTRSGSNDMYSCFSDGLH